MRVSRKGLRELWRWRNAKLLAVALFLYAVGGPALLAKPDNSQTFFIEQRQLEEQKQQKAQPERPAPAPKHPAHQAPRDFVPTETTRTDGTGAPVEPTFFVDVLGDSLALLTADGLREAFADNPKIAVNSKARDTSGLSRDDVFDWVKAAKDLVAEKKRIDYVVMEIGINDWQPIKDGADTLDPTSDRWREIYGRRIEAVVDAFHEAHIPVLWVGLPPMHNDRFNDEVSKLNELYKDQAVKAGAKFIDIWDAFADENGSYNAFGPDIEGRTARLRASDGVYFTKAGARKAAQFVETDIRRAFDSAKPADDLVDLPPDVEHAAIDINAEIRREMGLAPGPDALAPTETNKPLAGPVLSLTGRPVSPGGALATRPAWANGAAVGANILASGVEPQAKLGRADDFSWPPQP
jgi:uncharacterized protein